MHLSRRQCLASLSVPALLKAAVQGPELVLYNANVITIDSRNPRAQALAIAGDRLLAVGSNEEVRGLATPSTRQENVGGKTIVPGFIDAHTHPASSGRSHLRMVDCDLRSIADIQSAIRKRAAQTPRGDWVLGFKYDDTKTAEGELSNTR